LNDSEYCLPPHTFSSFYKEFLLFFTHYTLILLLLVRIRLKILVDFSFFIAENSIAAVKNHFLYKWVLRPLFKYIKGL